MAKVEDRSALTPPRSTSWPATVPTVLNGSPGLWAMPARLTPLNFALAALQQAVTPDFSKKLSMSQLREVFPLGHRPEFRLILLDLAFPDDPFKRGD